MRKTIKRLLVTIMTLTIVLAGIVPGTAPLEAQARPLVSSQISTDEINSLMDDRGIVLSPGAGILFSQYGCIEIDGKTTEYESGSAWTNDTSNEYYVDALSYNSDFHGVTLVSCSFSGNYFIDVWYDESFEYGTRETHVYRFELGSATTMSKDVIIDKLYDYFPSDIIIKDDALYTNKTCSDVYGDVVDAENGDISLEGGTYDVVLNAFVLVGRESTGDNKEWQYADVTYKPGNWKYEAVKYASENGIMTGVKPGEFQPDEPLTRAMFATMLYRMAGEPAVTYTNKYPDVPADKWYSDAVIWASEQEIVGGYVDGRFGTKDNITREQIAKMLMQFGKNQGYDVSQSAEFGTFADASSVSSWANEYMKWAVGSGMIGGKDINGKRCLAPKGNATRAESATMLMRFMEKY